MNTLEIDEFAKNNKFVRVFYGGTFAADRLPKLKISNLPKSYIINTCIAARDDDPICHWVGVFISKKGVDYFDSGGTDSYRTNKHIKKFILNQGKPVNFSIQQIQSMTSEKCGLFTLLFVYAKSININLKSFLKVFTEDNLEKNDEIVEKLFSCAFLRNNGKKCFKR